jgi:hypothetical protein
VRVIQGPHGAFRTATLTEVLVVGGQKGRRSAGDTRAQDGFVAIAAHELRNAMAPKDSVPSLALKTARDQFGLPIATTSLECTQRPVEDFLDTSTRLLEGSQVETGNFHGSHGSSTSPCTVLSVAQRYQVTAVQSCCALVTGIEDGIPGLESASLGKDS